MISNPIYGISASRPCFPSHPWVPRTAVKARMAEVSMAPRSDGSSCVSVSSRRRSRSAWVGFKLGTWKFHEISLVCLSYDSYKQRTSYWTNLNKRSRWTWDWVASVFESFWQVWCGRCSRNLGPKISAKGWCDPMWNRSTILKNT